jgi:hypothetical protein
MTGNMRVALNMKGLVQFLPNLGEDLIISKAN